MFRSEISVQLKIENTNCCMQLETGCALSLAPISFIKEVFPDVKIDPTNGLFCQPTLVKLCIL